MKYASPLLATLFLSLFSFLSVSYAEDDIGNSTTTGGVHVIAGEDVGGASGSIKNSRIVNTNYRAAYHGGQAGSYRVIWPRLYYGSKYLCTFTSYSKDSCMYTQSQHAAYIGKYTLSATGITRVYNTNPHMIGSKPSTIFYNWTK